VIVHGRPITARHEGGQRFAIRVRGHELIVDQPPSTGGADAGPSSTELFVASLVGCVAYYGHTFLARHGIAAALGAEADWWVDLGAERLSRVVIHVQSPSLPPALADGFRAAIEHCLVHNTLREEPEVSIEVMTGADADPSAI
jgi:uncharacterized OsmC-like protein